MLYSLIKLEKKVIINKMILKSQANVNQLMNSLVRPVNVGQCAKHAPIMSISSPKPVSRRQPLSVSSCFCLFTTLRKRKQQTYSLPQTTDLISDGMINSRNDNYP
jgi:hypothetical protein